MQPSDLLRSPNLENEEVQRVARALHHIQLTLLVTVIIAVPILIYQAQIYATFGLMAGTALLLFTIWLNRVGRVQLASLILLLAVLSVITFLAWQGNGIHDVIAIAFPLVLIIAGVLLNRNLYLLASALVILCAGLIVSAEITGLIQTTFSPITDPTDLIFAPIILVVIALVMRILSDSLFASMERSRESALQQSRLVLETRRQAEHLAILNRVGIAVASGLELEQVLVELYQQLKGVVPLDSFYVALIDRQANLVAFPIFVSAGERIYIPREKLDSGSGLTGEVIRTRRTLYLPDVIDPSTRDQHEVLIVGPGETRSYLGIPMHLHGEVMGVLSVQSEHPHAYSESQISLLQTITSQVSVAIDNARLFVEVMEALHREERLNQLAHLISGSLDLQFILESVVGISADLVGADAGTLSLISSDQEQILEIYNYNLPQELSQLHRRKGYGVTWEIIHSQNSIHLHEYSDHPKALPELTQAGYHAYLGVPILAGDQCLGVLSLLSSDPIKRFLERERALLEAVGRLAGSAIQNARLFVALKTELEERVRAENALKQRDTILEAVTYASEKFLAFPDWRSSIQEVLGRLGQEAVVSHAYLIEFTFPSGEEAQFSIPYAWSAPDSPVQLPPFSPCTQTLIQAGLNGMIAALKRGEIYIHTSHTANPLAEISSEVDFQPDLNARSIVSVPVIVNEALWGALSFDDCFAEREWTEVEVDALRVAAGVLSAAIQRQQADQALRQLNAELEQRVRQRTADLQNAYQELEAFTYSVSHDLRTPLRGVDGYSKLLLEDYGPRLDEEGRLYLENIRKATLQMSHLIEDLLKLSRVTRLEMRQEAIDLSEMVRTLAEELQRNEPSRQVIFQIAPGMKVNGDPSLMRLALENLISNAWKFTSKGDHARIEIGQMSEAPEQVFYVRDNGVGFDMKYSDKLFRPFQRLHNAAEFEGTGVGLATVQRIIQRHAGRIWAEAAVGQGACFYFSLPTP